MKGKEIIVTHNPLCSRPPTKFTDSMRRRTRDAVKQKRREENKVDYCQSLFTITNRRTGVDGFLSNYEVILSSTDVADEKF